MEVDMRVLLRDVPGSLIEALQPIAKHGGNVISVIHYRSPEKEVVPVEIKFKLAELRALEAILQDLKGTGVKVEGVEVDGRKYYRKHTLPVMLIGHVIDTDIRDTIDRINEVALVSDLDVVMPSPERRSSVLMNIEVEEEKLEALKKRLEEVCREKNILAIRSI